MYKPDNSLPGQPQRRENKQEMGKLTALLLCKAYNPAQQQVALETAVKGRESWKVAGDRLRPILVQPGDYPSLTWKMTEGMYVLESQDWKLEDSGQVQSQNIAY